MNRTAHMEPRKPFIVRTKKIGESRVRGDGGVEASFGRVASIVSTRSFVKRAAEANVGWVMATDAWLTRQ